MTAGEHRKNGASMWLALSPKTKVHLLFVFLGATLLALVTHAAWVCDDAYITFRTVENAVAGYGLRWNIDERVQTFTHPLWFGVLLMARLLTGELYFTVIGVSVLLLTGTCILLYLARGSNGGLVVALFAGTGSKALIDYSTSGLENVLSGTLVAAVLWVSVWAKLSRRHLFLCLFLAALAVLNRMDLAILLGPLSLYLVVRGVRCKVLTLKQLPLFLFLAGAPLLLWEVWSIFYYGFPFPNTAYAKLHTGVPALNLGMQGVAYVLYSIRLDPVSGALLVFSVTALVRRRSWEGLWLLAGLLLYLLYVCKVGGDFMAGRFLYVPIVVSMMVLAKCQMSSRLTIAGSVGLIALGLCASPSTWRYDLSQRDDRRFRGIVDERGFYAPCSSLFRVLPRHREPFCYSKGLNDQTGDATGRVIVSTRMGWLGYDSDPGVHIVDTLALCDPLLARMKIPNIYEWRPGHFARNVPTGYVESLNSGQNQLENPKLHELYDILLIVTRGNLMDRARMREILKLNLGMYNHLMNES